MAEVTRTQFWVGTGVTIASTILTVVVGALQTRESVRSSTEQTLALIVANRNENDRVHASTVLREISVAIDGVRVQLRAYGSMLFEIESCGGAVREKLRRCQERYNFNPQLAQDAWANLDATIKAASPFLVGKHEAQLLVRLQELKMSLQKEVSPHLPASPTTAARIRTVVEKISNAVSRASDELANVISQRTQAKR